MEQCVTAETGELVLAARLCTRQLNQRAGAVHYSLACHQGNRDKTLGSSEKLHLGEDHPEGLTHPLVKKTKNEVC